MNFFFHTGQDASSIFETTHHSTEAREMMQAFYVGQYVEVGTHVLLYPPQTLFVGGILFSRCPCVRPCVRP